MKKMIRELRILVPVLAAVAVICLMSPGQGLAADDPAMTAIEADIQTAHETGDNTALETALNEYKVYLTSLGMTDEELQAYLDNWLRTRLPGITDDQVTEMMAGLFPGSFDPEFLKDPEPPETPILPDEEIPSPV